MSAFCAGVVPRSFWLPKPHIANAPYFLPCGAGRPAGNGFSKGGILGLEIILREIDDAVLAEGRAGVLEVCGDVHSVVDASAAAYHGVGRQW